MSGGTGSWYKYFGFLITDGAKSVADIAGAYWLLDEIAIHYRRSEDRQFWTLIVRGKKAVLIMQEDSHQPFLVKQKIEFTDFPQGRWKIWCFDKVILLPNEY